MNGLKYNAFARFKKAFTDKGKDPIITQHTLQLEAVISTTETTMRFPLTEQDAGMRFKTESRLNVNDVFQITEIGIFLAAPVGNDDVTYRIASYPNTALFPTTAAALQGIYKGHLRITVDNKVYLPKWDVLEHLFVPRTQDANSPAAVQDSFNAARDGYVQLNPTIVLSGNRTSDIQINLPTAITALEAGKAPRVILRLKGFLAQQAATFNI